MKTITDEQFKAALKKADNEEKGILKKLFPEQFKEDPYIEACKVLGKTPLPPLADRSDQDLVSADAFYRLTICIRVKNMINGKIWKQVYDGVEKHWFPRWLKNSAGFGLPSTICDYWDVSTTVGERLEYRTEQLLLEGVEEFDQYYQDYLTVKHGK